MTTWRWTREEWFALPLEVRQRWWRDTDYSKREPSPEMIEAIEDERRHPERVRQRIEQRRQEDERLAQEAREQLIKEAGQRKPTVITGPTARCERCGAVGHVVNYVKPFPAFCLPCFAEECRRVEDKTDGSISQVADYLRREKLQ
jgi:hypothetical protein